ncbi:MAG: Fic family protein [bacterium]
MRSLTPTFLNRLSFTSGDLGAIARIGEFRGRQDLYRRQTPETLKALQVFAIIESSESSNRLEGIRAPRERIERLVRRDATPRGRSEQEIAGYRDVLRLIHKSAPDMPFSPNLVLQLHRMMYSYLPQPGGSWKMTDNEIVEIDPVTGERRVRFRPLPAVVVPQAMEDLAAGCRGSLQEQAGEPLVVVPLTILDLLCIHPFTDGNGRISRLVTLLLLYQHGYEVGRFISLERVFEDAKEGYYESLQSASTGWHQAEHDVMLWLRYFWGVLLRAYEEFASRVGVLGRHKGAKSEFVREAALARIAPFRLSELERDCPGVSRELIKRVLRQLKAERSLLVEGRGAGARWRRVSDD